MMDEIAILSISEKIEAAFKSMIKSGRPDVTDEQNNSLIPDIYVDLYENNYVLRQVMDDNHTLLKGRKGTGKSTIFLRAEQELSQSPDKVCIYINLQSIYEEIRTANSDASGNALEQYQTYCNFFAEIITSLAERLGRKLKNNEFKQLIVDVEQGKYIDADFQKSIEITKTSQSEQSYFMQGNWDGKGLQLAANTTHKSGDNETRSHTMNELRLFSIHEIVGKIRTLTIFIFF